MNMHQCPHCGKPGITALRRAFLGPAIPTTCSQCGQKVGVPGWSIVIVLPLLTGLAAALVIEMPKTAAVWSAALGIAITGLLWETCVPLIKR